MTELKKCNNHYCLMHMSWKRSGCEHRDNKGFYDNCYTYNLYKKQLILEEMKG